MLVQLAVNAERHDGATAVRLDVDRTTFRVVWRHTGAAPRITTARRRAERDRWGLGFARIAADAIGGTVYPPRDTGDGALAATLELGIRRLALPLAALRDGRVCRATRSWDEETGLAPGSPTGMGSKLDTIEAAAASVPGRIVVDGGFSARAGLRALWVAVPPDDAAVRAREVIAGLIHERALSDHIEEPARSNIGGLALLLATLLGEPMPRVPIAAWSRRLHELGPAMGMAGGDSRLRRRRGDRPAGRGRAGAVGVPDSRSTATGSGCGSARNAATTRRSACCSGQARIGSRWADHRRAGERSSSDVIDGQRADGMARSAALRRPPRAPRPAAADRCARTRTAA